MKILGGTKYKEFSISHGFHNAEYLSTMDNKVLHDKCPNLLHARGTNTTMMWGRTLKKIKFIKEYTRWPCL